MYLDYWGFDRFPFDNVPDPDFFFLSKPHEEGLTRLLYALDRRKGCALLSGDIGCGKTTLSKVLLQRISEERVDFGIISNPCVEPKEFLQDVLYKLNITPVPDSKVEILRLLNQKLTENIEKDMDTLLVVDEAQILTMATLEEIRLLLNFQLSNQFLITIFLLGQPELVAKIKKIKQLDQRIAIRYLLRPFTLEETESYILFREKKAGHKGGGLFSGEAIEILYTYSNGLPRIINNLCDMALLIACGKQRKMVTSDIIRDIISDGTVI
jgi:general secretion pathway protein A